MKRIGIDLGGTKTEIMLTHDNPTEIIERKRVPTGQENGYEYIRDNIAGLIRDYQKLCDKPPSIGIGIPGSINQETGLVRSSNTQCLIGKPFKKELEELVQSEVHMENDANCFALAEAMLGAGRNQRMVFGVIMGTGMGGGIVIDGKLWRGRHGMGGEWGHHSIDINGPQCWCGQKGCSELYLSGTGMQRVYQEISGVSKSMKDVYADYQNGDEMAKRALGEILVCFGRSIGNLLNAFDPDIVVLGGGASNLTFLYDEGVKSVSRHVFNDVFYTPIVKNELGDSSGIFGAALLA